MENSFTPTPGTKPASNTTGKWLVRGIAIVAILVLAYWNYSIFFGGLMSADPGSPDCVKNIGTVTDIHAAGGGSRKGRETYHMSYEYSVAGKKYQNKEEVTYNIYNRTRLNDAIDICYMKDNPSRSAVIGNDIRGESYFIVVLVDLGVLIVIIVVIRAGIKSRKKAKQMAQT